MYEDRTVTLRREWQFERVYPANRTVRNMNQEKAIKPTMMAMGKFWKVNISFITTIYG
jgi:hypothetical protein